jgi:transposase
MPVNILNLLAYEVASLHENDHDYHIKASTRQHPVACIHCGHDKVEGFGRREQMVKDLPMHGKRVGLYVDTRRFRCKSCQVTFYEPLPGVNDKRLMTNRLVSWIGHQCVKRTFTSIADEVGVTEGTVRMIFKDYVSDLEKTVRFETPKWMGIDEIYLIKPRGVISNIENNTIVELLPNRNKETIIRYLDKLHGKEQIQYVAMDMWAPYRDAVIEVLPGATIVIDKFHVVRMANDALEKVRKSLRERLTPKQRRGLMHDRFVLLKRERELNDKEQELLADWTAKHPDLGVAYRLKEDFFAIYEQSSTIDQALARYEAWTRNITPEVDDAFHDLVRAWTNWRPWILNYFKHPVTNAYTESLNNLIRVMNRLGRGYSFEALRAKILFAHGAHKRDYVRPKFERMRMLEGVARFSLPPDHFKDEEVEWSEQNSDEGVLNYGASIELLVQMIENGEI